MRDRQLHARLDLLALAAGVASTWLETRREQRRGALELGALGGVMGGDMGDLVRHHGGDLGAVVGEREQAAGDENVARGQREGVDDRANRAA